MSTQEQGYFTEDTSADVVVSRIAPLDRAATGRGHGGDQAALLSDPRWWASGAIAGQT